MSANFLVDSHCHINFPDYHDDRDAVLERARQAGIGGALCVGVDLKGLQGILDLANTRAGVYASVGVHPNTELIDEPEPSAEALQKLCALPSVVGVGESGLDYYRSSSGLDMQRERFRSHLRAANACRLPIIVHTRNAKKDTMSVIAGVGGANAGGVMHCFTEDWEMARHALDYGFYISFSGIVTFKNAHELKDVAKKVPADRLLIETDAPYLSPAPNRGKRNEPAYIAQTAKYIATLKNIAVEDLIGSTCENFFSLFSRATKLDSQNDFGRVLCEL